MAKVKSHVFAFLYSEDADSTKWMIDVFKKVQHRMEEDSSSHG